MGLLNLLFGSTNSNTEKLQDMLSNDAIIIDVRSKGEFQSGNVKGSINIPLQEIDNKIEKIKKLDRPAIVCCASGARSNQAARIIQSNGIECENGGSWNRVNQLIKN